MVCSCNNNNKAWVNQKMMLNKIEHGRTKNTVFRIIEVLKYACIGQGRENILIKKSLICE